MYDVSISNKALELSHRTPVDIIGPLDVNPYLQKKTGMTFKSSEWCSLKINISTTKLIIIIEANLRKYGVSNKLQ